MVWENAILYNAPDTAFHRTAQRIKNNAQPILDKLAPITAPNQLSLAETSNGLNSDQSIVGDLEPSLAVLQILTMPDSQNPERDNLAALFAYELEKPKEPTPPPPTPPPAPVRKTLTAEERRKKREERDAKAKQRASLSGRNTRGAKALEKAFAEEAGVNIPSDAELTAGRRTRGRPSGLVFDAPVKVKEEKARKRSDKKKQDTEEMVSEMSSGGRAKEQSIILGTVGGDAEIAATDKEANVPDASESPLHRTKETSVDTTTTRRSRTQPGVAALETYAHITDKERRERERALDIVTEEVGNRDHFTRFNVGWVLPEGTKRRRVERVPDPPKTPGKLLQLVL